MVRITIFRARPGIAAGLLDAESHAPRYWIKRNHDDFHGIAFLEHVGGMANALPGNLADWQQAYHAVFDFEKCAKAFNSRDASRHGSSDWIFRGRICPGI